MPLLPPDAATQAPVSRVNAVEFGRILRHSREFALIDLRDAPAFAQGAPLYGNAIALADLAGQVPRFIPHRHTLVALVDADGQRIDRAAAILAGLGYTHLLGLDDGLDGNQRLPVLPIRIAGPRVISGEIERTFGTPVTTPQELQAERAAGQPVVVLDTRSAREFAAGHVPGSLHAPGGEILAHVHQLGLSPQTHIVVTCAGRSRAVLGAQTLINAKVVHKVSTLDFGTHGWRDAGHALADGPDPHARPLTAASTGWAAQAVRGLVDSLPQIDAATLQSWLADSSRTTYALDVRQPEAFDQGHLPGSVSAPGGQLCIVIGDWVAVQGARLVLIDDTDGFRAATTAHWFRRLGWDVTLLLHGFAPSQAAA